MSLNINLASTSSLLPENNLWEKKNFKINFEDLIKMTNGSIEDIIE